MERTVSRIPIKLRIEDLGQAKGELIRYLSPRTVDTLVRILPLEGRATLWKNEIYFEVPLKLGVEKPKGEVKEGTMAYWPMGNAFCVFYKDTKPHSQVSIIGDIVENLDIFPKIKSGTIIRVEEN